MAIRIAASLARREGIDFSTLRERLRQRMIEVLQDRSTPEEDVRLGATLDLTYDRLDEPAQKLLARVSVYEEPFRQEGAAALSEDGESESVLGQLREHHLLDLQQAGTSSGEHVTLYRMHPVVRSYGLRKLPDEAEVRLAAGRYLVQSTYLNEIVEGIRHLEQARALGEVSEAVLSAQPVLARQGLWAMEEGVLAAGLRATKAQGDRVREAMFLGETGNHRLRRGDAQGAIPYFEEHLAISREIGDRRGEGDDLASARMTLRYMKTLSAEESLKINQGTDFRW